MVFTAPMVLEQLLLGGVLATVKIRQQGFAYRIPHEKFVHSYGLIRRKSKDSSPSKIERAEDAARSLVDSLKLLLPLAAGTDGQANIAIGKNKVCTSGNSLYCNEIANPASPRWA